MSEVVYVRVSVSPCVHIVSERRIECATRFALLCRSRQLCRRVQKVVLLRA
jgi:hypothetical protein